MLFRSLLIISLSSLLFACSTSEVKEEPVQVEDLTSRKQTNTTDSGTQTYEIDGSTTSEFSELDNPQSPLSIRIIYFEYDSSEIQSEYHQVIEAHATYLSRNQNLKVTLEGHADERGSREYNLALGEKRAQSIRQLMTLLGGSSNQIRLISYGEERPQVDDHDETAWQQNRRVEILY